MKVNTKYFGSIEVDEEELLTFEHGIPGFEDRRRYFMVKYSAESPFYVLQSVDESGPVFILIGMDQVVPDYSIEITDEVVGELKIGQPEDTTVFAIVNIPGELAKATVNLAAPLLINVREKLGKQIILNNPSYSLKHPLFSGEQATVEKNRHEA